MEILVIEITLSVLIALIIIYEVIKRRNRKIREEYYNSKYSKFYIRISKFMYDRKQGIHHIIDIEDATLVNIGKEYSWNYINEETLNACVAEAKQFDVVYSTSYSHNRNATEGAGYTFTGYLLKQERKEWTIRRWL